VHIFAVLPAFNEAENLRPLLASLSHVRERLKPDELTVLVVDDGSTDGTGEMAAIRHPKNLGFPQALRTGLARALELSKDMNDCAVVMDADNTHPAETLIPMLEKFRRGSDVVIASRYCVGGSQRGVSLFRIFLSRACGGLLSVFFRVENVKDYTSSFRMIRMKTLRSLSEATGGEFFKEKSFVCACEFLFNLKTAGARFAEVPLALRYDLRIGKSKMNVARTVAGYFKLMSRLLLKG